MHVYIVHVSLFQICWLFCKMLLNVIFSANMTNLDTNAYVTWHKVHSLPLHGQHWSSTSCHVKLNINHCLGLSVKSGSETSVHAQLTVIALLAFPQPTNTLFEFIFQSTYLVTCLLLVSAVLLSNSVRVVLFQEACSPRTLDLHLGWRSISRKHCSSTEIYLGLLSSAQRRTLGMYSSLQLSFAFVCIFPDIYPGCGYLILSMHVIFCIEYCDISRCGLTWRGAPGYWGLLDPKQSRVWLWVNSGYCLCGRLCMFFAWVCGFTLDSLHELAAINYPGALR